MEYGYARCSTRTQHEDRQIITLKEHGIREKNIVIDKQSGKDFEREGYKKLISRIKPGDVLFVGSIDRLGRNYAEILEQWRIITKEKECDIVIIDMPLLDTRNSKDLTGTLISDIVLQLLSYVSQKEREYIRTRTLDGIAAAKARGVKFGREPMVRPSEYEELKVKWQAKEISARAAAAQLGITHKTFLKWVREE